MGGIGTSSKRLEDPPLLLGKGLFVADINHDSQIYMRVVRSNVAHGKINSINSELAKKIIDNSNLKVESAILFKEAAEKVQKSSSLKDKMTFIF